MHIEGEDKYFSAREARSVSEAVKGDLMRDELDFIYEKINNARFEGKNSITFSNKSFSKATTEFLKSKGFKVEYFYGVQWDPADDTIISW